MAKAGPSPDGGGGDETNDLLRQLLEASRKGVASEGGPRGDRGWKTSASSFGDMIKEIQDRTQAEIARLPKKNRDMLDKYTMKVEHPEFGGMSETWLHMRNLHPKSKSFLGGTGLNGEATVAGAAATAGNVALSPIASSLAIPIAMGFGDALGKARGWKDMDDGLQRMARRMRESGGGLSGVGGAAIQGFGMATTGPMAIAASLAASVGVLHQSTSAMYKFQMSQYASLNESLALTTAKLDMGDIRRSQKVGGMISGSADELGLAMNTFRDQLVPMQAFGINAMNKTMSFAMGATNQAIAAVKPSVQEILGNMPAFAAGGFAGVSDKMTAHQKWSIQTGETMWKMWEGAKGVPAFNWAGARNPLVKDEDLNPSARAGKTFLERFVRGTVGTGGLLGPVGGLWSVYSGASADAANDPATKAQLALANKQNEARKAEAIRMIDELTKLSKDKPANVLAAGMTQAFAESMKAGIRTSGDMDAMRAAGQAGMNAGMAAEEARMKEAEEADKEVMRSWVSRVNDMSDWHLRNPAPLRAPVWQPNVVAMRPPVAGGGRRVPGNLAGRGLLFQGQPRLAGPPNVVPQPGIAAGILKGMVPGNRPQLPFGPAGQRRGANGNPFGMGGNFGF